VPVFGTLADRWFFEGDDMFYVPADRVIRIDQPFKVPEHTVMPSRLLEHFIARASHHWIMDFCICRESRQCEDYPIDLGCLFLGAAALGINPKLGRRVTSREAMAHARRSRDAGLVHLIGRNKLDTIWLGTGPGERLLTVCSCCPCCCVCRVLPQLASRISARYTPMAGVSVVVSDRCVGCGTCTRDVCFVDAIRMGSGHAVITEDCRGCGRCVDACPNGAIDLSVDPVDFVEASIVRVSAAVDVC
jgi:NAD-dependent dihydropyrimidine dehydrogenase PreA subunit